MYWRIFVWTTYVNGGDFALSHGGDLYELLASANHHPNPVLNHPHSHELWVLTFHSDTTQNHHALIGFHLDVEWWCSDIGDSLVWRTVPIFFCRWLLNSMPECKTDYTSGFARKKNVSVFIYKRPNQSTNKNIRAILSSYIFIIISAICKWKQGRAKSLDCALCENEVGAQPIKMQDYSAKSIMEW